MSEYPNSRAGDMSEYTNSAQCLSYINKVKLPFRRHYRSNEEVRYIPVKHIAIPSESDDLCSGVDEHVNGAENSDQPIRKHFLLDFFTITYVWAVFNRATWYIKIYSLLHLLVDVVLRTGHKYFVRVFARNVINKDGLLGTYQTMLDYSQEALCAALKLLSEPTNIPAMLNCALGKDRTGVVSALVLACMGKSKEYIAEDYARSEDLLEPQRARIYADLVERMHMHPTFVSAKYETMMETLQYIDKKYGGVTKFLESIGFTLSDQQQLRMNLAR